MSEEEQLSLEAREEIDRLDWMRRKHEESVAGINVRELRDEKQRLELRCAQLEEEARQQEEFYGNRIGILESCNLQLEREIEWLYQAEDRIAQLEEALEHARWVITSYTAAQEKYLAPIDAALYSSEPRKEEKQMVDIWALKDAAQMLFDNRLGWSDGRAPYAPRDFWADLGAALYGEDDSRVIELRNPEGPYVEPVVEESPTKAELEAKVSQLEEALQSVDRQVPDAIGGAPYVISPGALYAVRAALYGSGGPRPKEGAALSGDPSKAPEKKEE